MDIEEHLGPPRGLLLGLGVVAIVLAGALAGEFVFRLQPALTTGRNAPAGVVLMPLGAGSDTSLNFSPATITVIIGQNNTVNFVNKDSTVHTVTADGGSFDSGNVQAGQTWTHTFTTPGTYAYHCVYHPWMKAKIIVLASGSAAGGVTVDIPAGTGSNDALNYAPSSLKVVLGVNSTVTFVNQDTTTHTVTADDGAFDSGNIAPGSSWSHTFNATGTFAFHCIYHSWMKGTITVLSG